MRTDAGNGHLVGGGGGVSRHTPLGGHSPGQILHEQTPRSTPTPLWIEWHTATKTLPFRYAIDNYEINLI